MLPYFAPAQRHRALRVPAQRSPNVAYPPCSRAGSPRTQVPFRARYGNAPTRPSLFLTLLIFADPSGLPAAEHRNGASQAARVVSAADHFPVQGPNDEWRSKGTLIYSHACRRAGRFWPLAALRHRPGSDGYRTGTAPCQMTKTGLGRRRGNKSVFP